MASTTKSNAALLQLEEALKIQMHITVNEPYLQIVFRIFFTNYQSSVPVVFFINVIIFVCVCVCVCVCVWGSLGLSFSIFKMESSISIASYM